MTEFRTFRDVISLWPKKTGAAAAILGSNQYQISKWWQRNNIPPEWWPEILKTEEAIAAGLNADILMTLAVKRKAFPSADPMRLQPVEP